MPLQLPSGMIFGNLLELARIEVIAELARALIATQTGVGNSPLTSMLAQEAAATGKFQPALDRSASLVTVVAFKAGASAITSAWPSSSGFFQNQIPEQLKCIVV